MWVYPRVYGGTGIKNGISPNHRGLSPCVRGNLITVSCASSLFTGLSPCVRGNRGTDDCAVASCRSIPVCTGEPGSATSAASSLRVYPRVYGGTDFLVHLGSPHVGLSPCVRGNLLGITRRPSISRSIPVCTGEPRQTSVLVNTFGVYPRVYGGTIQWIIRTRWSWGLSPCVRGNLELPHLNIITVGSIPVCTGEP